MDCKYPNTCIKYGRKDLVFTVENKVYTKGKNFEDGESPMLMHKGYSCFQISIADSNKGQGGSGCIELNHIPDMEMRTAKAMDAIMKAEMAPKKEKQSKGKLDLKVSFLPLEMKEDKGKSIEVLMNKYDAETLKKASDLLLSQAQKGGAYAKSNKDQAEGLFIAFLIKSSFELKMGDSCIAELLKTNPNGLAQYASQNPNTKESSVINRCLALLKNPENNALFELDGEEVTTNKLIIYKPLLKTPNNKKVDEEGYVKAYELGVFCSPDRNYPFTVELTTMKGKPMNNNQIGLQQGTIKERKTFSIDLTSWEWNNIISTMKNQLTMAEYYQYGYSKTVSEQLLQANRQKQK